MNRLILARMAAIIALLAVLIPLLPGSRDDPLGLGGFQKTWKINQRLSRLPESGPDRSALLRFGGMQGKARARRLFDFVERVKADSEGEGQTVQTRGISRNEMWVLAYDFYPVRVIGRFREEGGGAGDPVLPGVDWTLTQDEKQLTLERVK